MYKNKISELGAARMAAFLENSVGSRDQILVESGNKGHGRSYARIRLEGDFITPGSLVDVTVTGHDGQMLTAARITG